MSSQPIDFNGSPPFDFQGNTAYDRNAIPLGYQIIEVWSYIASSCRSQNHVAGPYAPNTSDIAAVVAAADTATNPGGGNWGDISGADYGPWRTGWGGIAASTYDYSALYSLGLRPMPLPYTSILHKLYLNEFADAGSFNPTGGGAPETFANDGAGYAVAGAYPPSVTHPVVREWSGLLFGSTGFNGPYPGSHINSAIQYAGGTLFSSPFFSAFPTYQPVSIYDAQQLCMQCSFWLYHEAPGNYTDPGGHTTNIDRNKVFGIRSKWRASLGANYWWASVDVWQNSGTGLCDFRNITLLGEAYAGPSQWVDLGFVKDISGNSDTTIPSGTPNGVGRLMLCIFGETPAAFTTRTGLTFTNYP